jgi:membrane-bound serine protease (ClpP class)
MSPPAAVRRLILMSCAAALVLGALAPPVSARDGGSAPTDGRVIDILQLSGPLTPPALSTLRDLLEDANQRDAELVLVEIDAPGAIAVDAVEVVAVVRNSPVPVVVWVGPFDARSSGAATSLLAAAHVPAASRFAEIGGPCPPRVDRGCGEDDRALIGELLAERGVDEGPFTVDVGADLADTGPVSSGEEAASVGLVDITAEGLEPLLIDLDGREVTTVDGTRELRVRQDEVTIRFHDLGLFARLLNAALDPTLFYLILLTVLFLLAFEMFQPGFGVAGVAAALLLPLLVYGVVVLPVSWWAVALILAGMALLAVDLAIAGLGIPTVAGAAAVGAGSWWLYSSDHPVLAISPWLILLVVLFSVVFFVWIMTVVLRAQAGPEVGEVGAELVGKVGVVRSTMNPEGHVFVAGALWRARWTGEDRGRVRTGTRVRIVGVEGTTLLVDDAEAPVVPGASARHRAD